MELECENLMSVLIARFFVGVPLLLLLYFLFLLPRRIVKKRSEVLLFMTSLIHIVIPIATYCTSCAKFSVMPVLSAASILMIGLTARHRFSRLFLPLSLPAPVYIIFYLSFGIQVSLGMFLVNLIAFIVISVVALYSLHRAELRARKAFSRKIDIEVGQMVAKKEDNRIQMALLGAIPKPVLDRLRVQPQSIVQFFPSATVVACQFVGMSQIVTKGSAESHALLKPFYVQLCKVVENYEGVVLRFVGSIFVAVTGGPGSEEEHPRRGLDLAVEVHKMVKRTEDPNLSNLRVKIGVASGPLVGGLLGEKGTCYSGIGVSLMDAITLCFAGSYGRILCNDTFQRLTSEYCQFQTITRTTKVAGYERKSYLLKARKKREQIGFLPGTAEETCDQLPGYGHHESTAMAPFVRNIGMATVGGGGSTTQMSLMDSVASVDDESHIHVSSHLKVRVDKWVQEIIDEWSEVEEEKFFDAAMQVWLNVAALKGEVTSQEAEVPTAESDLKAENSEWEYVEEVSVIGGGEEAQGSEDSLPKEGPHVSGEEILRVDSIHPSKSSGVPKLSLDDIPDEADGASGGLADLSARDAFQSETSDDDAALGSDAEKLKPGHIRMTSDAVTDLKGWSEMIDPSLKDASEGDAIEKITQSVAQDTENGSPLYAPPPPQLERMPALHIMVSFPDRREETEYRRSMGTTFSCCRGPLFLAWIICLCAIGAEISLDAAVMKMVVILILQGVLALVAVLPLAPKSLWEGSLAFRQLAVCVSFLCLYVVAMLGVLLGVQSVGVLWVLVSFLFGVMVYNMLVVSFIGRVLLSSSACLVIVTLHAALFGFVFCCFVAFLIVECAAAVAAFYFEKWLRLCFSRSRYFQEMQLGVAARKENSKKIQAVLFPEMGVSEIRQPHTTFQRAGVLVVCLHNFFAVTRDMGPRQQLTILNRLVNHLDKLVTKYDLVEKVRNFGNFFVVIGRPKTEVDDKKDEGEISEEQAGVCPDYLKQLGNLGLEIVQSVNFMNSQEGKRVVSCAVGIHHGNILRVNVQKPFVLTEHFGDVTNRATEMALFGPAFTILVSRETYFQMHPAFVFGNRHLLPSIEGKATVFAIHRLRTAKDEAVRGLPSDFDEDEQRDDDDIDDGVRSNDVNAPRQVQDQVPEKEIRTVPE
eukprot:TRINITY_DN180_c0_g4_i1.p1 TRINITY_DN180_c0_g4~~TRINITY_DN180_c0_g4_i1.p1  ORF type:complete len:1320 (-),score=333.29 TRINITY_DN180_c0_g4_i1:1419-4862(-)